jgi:hypothetical protein
MSIHRDDRVYPGLEKAAHPDDAWIDRADHPGRQRPVERSRRGEFNPGRPAPRMPASSGSRRTNQPITATIRGNLS